MSDTPIETNAGDDDADRQEPTATVEDAAISPITMLEEERDRLKDQLLRTAADFDNFRKRSRKDVEQAERRGREAILRAGLTEVYVELLEPRPLRSGAAVTDRDCALAERWEVTADQLTYTFHLRSDVTWHDGAAFDAEDVAAMADWPA